MTEIIEQMLKEFTVVQLMDYEILSEWCYNVEGFCKKETAEIQKACWDGNRDTQT